MLGMATHDGPLRLGHVQGEARAGCSESEHVCRHARSVGPTDLRRGVLAVLRLGYPREPTARAMTSSEVSNAAVASTPMRILALLLNGIVSVGLNALEFVVDTYR